MSVLGSLVLALLLDSGQAISNASTIDRDAVATALEVRLGATARRWTIVMIEPGPDSSDVTAVLRRDDGRELRRVVTLEADTDDARARELAAALSLAIEQDAEVQRERGSAATRPKPSVLPEGWVAAGGHFSLGRPADAAGGASLRGGLWWGRRHLQPLVAIKTLHARPGPTRIDGALVGAGLAAGAPKGRWWFGGSAIASYAFTHAVQRNDDGASSFVSELTALVQLRTHGLVVGLRAGIETRTPGTRLVGADTDYRLGNLRFVGGVEIGATIGARNRRARLEASACARSNCESRVGYTAMDREPSPRRGSRRRARRGTTR